MPFDEPSCSGLAKSGRRGRFLARALSSAGVRTSHQSAVGTPRARRISLVRALSRQSASVNGSLPEYGMPECRGDGVDGRRCVPLGELVVRDGSGGDHGRCPRSVTRRLVFRPCELDGAPHAGGVWLLIVREPDARHPIPELVCCTASRAIFLSEHRRVSDGARCMTTRATHAPHAMPPKICIWFFSRNEKNWPRSTQTLWYDTRAASRRSSAS